MSDETFVIAVSGNGMKNAGISDGDLVCFKKSNRAEDGDIVLAAAFEKGKWKRMIARYRIEKGIVKLYAETDYRSYAPFVWVTGDIKILGIFQKVIKWI